VTSFALAVTSWVMLRCNVWVSVGTVRLASASIWITERVIPRRVSSMTIRAPPA